MQVAKWGNSLAIRLPAAVVEALNLCEGDDIEVVVADERLFAVKRKAKSRQLLESLHRLRGRMPADFKFDRESANERG